MSEHNWPAICRYITERVGRASAFVPSTGPGLCPAAEGPVVRAYHRDWAACGALIDALRVAGFGIEIHSVIRDDPPFADVMQFIELGDSRWKGYRHYGNTIPEAVTLAALRALGGEEDE